MTNPPAGIDWSAPQNPEAVRLVRAGIPALVEAVTSGAVSAGDVAAASLDVVRRLDRKLGAFSHVLVDEALAEAAERDAARSSGAAPGPLHAVPVAIKEENDVRGAVTTFGGSANRTPAPADGHVTARLREAGAVVVGKTTMPEFGQIPFTESRRYGCARNPWGTDRTPGGSSGGTAIAVATGMVPVGIGGDGGGSIRIPAALNGLFGLKPTRGRVSTAPHPFLWGGLGVVGPLSRSVLDSAIVFDVIRGNVPGDRFVAPPTTDFVDAARAGAAGDVAPLRIGWSTASPTPGVKPCAEHVAAVRETAALLTDLGHHVVEVDPRYPDATAAFVPQMLGGVRFEADLVEDRSALEPRTRRLAAAGFWATPKVVDAAIRRGERLADRVDARVFDGCDVLLTPVVPHRPRRVGAFERAGLVTSMLRSLPAIAYTALWNVTGHPAASVPAGFAADGLPTAVQLVGRRGAEVDLLRLAAQLEVARPWADRWPPLAD
ncbi:amidase [Nocardioides sp.]|uniref:amidase n=1 Tax=Nocardioides sp. TaxID=35761 RepID=UPI003513C79F